MVFLGGGGCFLCARYPCTSHTPCKPHPPLFAVFVHMGASNTFERAPSHEPELGECTPLNAPCTYRGTSLRKKCHHPRTTIRP